MSENLATPAPRLSLFRCPRCEHEQITEEEPERCPVCNFHGLPDGRWIMELLSSGD